MLRFQVCKTIVSHPHKRSFVLFDQQELLSAHPSLESLAASIRTATPKGQLPDATRWVKNEAPGDVCWIPASGRVMEFERLDKKELRELARLLRQ